jgi:hypothetical protein
MRKTQMGKSKIVIVVVVVVVVHHHLLIFCAWCENDSAVRG